MRFTGRIKGQERIWPFPEPVAEAQNSALYKATSFTPNIAPQDWFPGQRRRGKEGGIEEKEKKGVLVKRFELPHSN